MDLLMRFIIHFGPVLCYPHCLDHFDVIKHLLVLKAGLQND